jgi:hypothetical protein
LIPLVAVQAIFLDFASLNGVIRQNPVINVTNHIPGTYIDFIGAPCLCWTFQNVTMLLPSSN